MFQGIQLALNGVHLPVDVILGDVLVSLNLLDSTPVTKKTLPSPSACLLPGALPFLQPALATMGPGPQLCPTPQWGQMQDPSVGKGQCGDSHNPSMPLAPAQTHPEGGTTPCLSWQPCPLLCHSRSDIPM